MKSIVLTGGGTAGHVIPHLAVYPYIKDSFDKFYYIGSYDGIEKQLISGKFEYFAVPTAKLKRTLTFDNFKILPNLLMGIKRSEDILKKLKPTLVFSKGGYVSVPVILAANKLKIPVVTHESDYTLGLANKIVAKKCDYVLTSFENAGRSLKNNLFTGAPVREFALNKAVALKYFGFSGTKPILLIVGGSSGSQAINNAITDLLPDILQKYDLLHICGYGKTTEKSKGYYKTGYLDDMSLAYSVSDVCLSRAGAGACFELMSLNIPTLFIPLSKKASRGDQILNAKYFLNKGMCNLLYEENLSKKYLLNQIDKTYNEKNYYINNMKKCKTICGNQAIANVIKKYA